jgi:hypothetical protein
MDFDQYAENSPILVVIEKICSMTSLLLYTCRDLSFNRLEKKIPNLEGLQRLTNM